MPLGMSVIPQLFLLLQICECKANSVRSCYDYSSSKHPNLDFTTYQNRERANRTNSSFKLVTSICGNHSGKFERHRRRELINKTAVQIRPFLSYNLPNACVFKTPPYSIFHPLFNIIPNLFCQCTMKEPYDTGFYLYNWVYIR